MIRTGRTPIILLLIAAVLATAGTRYWAEDYRRSVLNRGQLVITDSSQSLSNMSSYALALLLGGLRGPLVMMLWISSESQKADKNLEDFDTKVEWIRMLQPEFDSVHMFQIWNKAYNISVQMASLANKYTTILDALDYADEVNKQRPNDINIIMAIADVYFNKLGNSSEKEYYRKRVVHETQWRVVRDTRRGDGEFHPTRLPPMLDQAGNVLPTFRSTLSYLIPYEPFPYGLTPFAISYNYYRLTQYLQNVDHEQHLQISPSVIDSRPAIALENWATEELTTGRRLELQLYNQPIPSDPNITLDLQTANVPMATARNGSVDVQHLIYCYQRAARLAADSSKAYLVHLKNPDFNMANMFTYEWHSDNNIAVSHLAAADADYIRAIVASGAEQRTMLRKAREDYVEAVRESRIVMFKWFTPDEALALLHVKKMEVGNLSNAQLQILSNGLDRLEAMHSASAMNGMEDRMDYQRYVIRSVERIKQINQVVGTD